MGQGILLARVHGNVIFAGAGRIHKFDLNVFPNPAQGAIPPYLPGVGGSRTASLLEWMVVGAASRMRLDFIRWTPDDVHAAAVGFPARNARKEALVSVGKAAVVLFLEYVGGRFRFGITSVPEDFNELLALFVCREAK